ELIPPDDDGLEGERALAERRHHGLAAGLDTLGDSNLAFARKEFHRAHVAEVHAHRVVSSLGRFFGTGFEQNRALLDFDSLALAFDFLLLWLLTGLDLFLKPSLFGLDHVDAHLAESRQNALDLLGIDLFRSQQRVDLVVGDIAAPLGSADQRLYGRIRKI